MKICIDATVSESRGDTGIGVYIYEILKGMHEDKNLEGHVFYALVKTNDSFKEFRNSKNLKFINITEYDNTENMKAAKDNNNDKENLNVEYEEKIILKILKDLEIDVYHMPRNAIFYPHVKICKYVVTIHDLIPMIMPDVIRKTSMKDFLMNVPRGIYNSDMIITVSNHSKKDIVRYFKMPEEKIKVTYLAPEDIYRKAETAEIFEIKAEEVMKKHDISYPYILYIGGFNKRKNVALLIDAFKILIDRHEIDDKIKLVLAGSVAFSGKYLEEKVNELKLEDRVKFIGRIEKEDMPYIYSRALIFVYPSLYEGFGLPPIEALEKDVLVLTSNVTSLPEILKESVIYFDPNDVYDICSKIKPFVLELQEGKSSIEIEKEKRKKTKNELLESLSFENTWKETLEVYMSLK